MPSLKKLMSISKTSDIDCGWGITARMTYQPALVTEDLDDEAKGETGAARIADQLCTLVTSWELTGPVPIQTVGSITEGSIVPEGEPVPLDPEVVRHLPLPLLQGMFQGLMGDAVPKSPKTPNA